ncbi:MAG: hypothetical protein US63_C0012G0021 [Candidatus Moranbacteria bacterium GW2011_GWC2_37_8]|nr:MAG: hypothetical protein US63_C0012G0021 [Candidatus Moranbacteria bacterium GW2011_GWC2_37_8]KKQ62852.1 MAG: Ribosome small subunit-dependent GTPase A [Parcubacteria group bacterium GW2011_GWC1_38_22]KKQ81109.1 MAG: hypothetical protein UT03_C0012G0011 [Candidatus Moranbacteria bacterium GW2011_GWD2_38_7]
MDLEILGWRRYSQSQKNIENFSLENIARVAVENRGGYLLYSQFGELEGIVQGKFIKKAEKESDYPKVGDWVNIVKLQGEQKAVIESILPRFSKLSRRRISKDRSEINKQQEEQIIATNIDIVFIMQGLDADFSLERLNRYMEAVKNGGAHPVVLLNKCDLIKNPTEKKADVLAENPGGEIFLVSAKTGHGLAEVKNLISEKSVVFVGSSGVGKSTLANALLGIDLQKIQEVRVNDSKGRHTTTKREMFLLSSGGILIDTPGMRELEPWEKQTEFAQEKAKNNAKRKIKNGRLARALIKRPEFTKDK